LCPACGEENPERARFCLNCAAALTTEPVARAEERKVVTVLFCDLVGFTARTDRADPEDARALLRTYHEAVRREIERYGGTVEKFIGDAVMAAFGAPVAHEDDAERAVRAALRMIEAVAQLNEEMTDLGLSVRIGVNTGEAVVALGARSGDGEGIVTGDVVNTASRLQTAAPVGGIVVGEVTYRATRDWIEYRPLEPTALKGKAELVPMWQVVAGRSRQGVDVDQHSAAPFLGRGLQLRLLTEAFVRAIDEPAVQLITISGEPGAGKSRLLWEFRRALDDDPSVNAFWRQGRCLPYGEGITFWALGEMVKSHAAILETDGAAEAMDKLRVAVHAVVEDPDQAAWVVNRLAPLIGQSSGAAGQDEAFAAWRTFVEGIATHGPLVLVFEDIHWADAALLEFIEHVAEWSTGVPIVIVCSARPELYERSPGWGGGTRNSTSIALAPLSDDDTTSIIAALLSRRLLPAELQATLVERAGGNPLFAEEYVRMLVDQGALSDHLEPTMAAIGAIPLPETIQATIAARLDTLPAGTKALLQDASVMGKVFWSGAVASMAGIGEADARQILHELARRELLRQARSTSVPGQVEYAFWHALVRDVAYGQIPRQARVRKHRQAATWIAATAGERVADVSEVLAYHYQQALDLARAAGMESEISDLEVATRDALAAAGDRAAQFDAHKAFDFYRRAADLTPQATEGRGRLLQRLIAAGSVGFGGSGDLDPIESGHLMEEVVADFEAAGDEIGAGQAMTQRSRQLWFAGQATDADTMLQRAITVLVPNGPTRELADAQAEMAGRSMLASRERDWLDWTEKAMATADAAGARDVYARALQFRAFLRELAGDGVALDELNEALRIGKEVGQLRLIESAYTNLADYLHESVGPREGWTEYAEGVEFLRRRGARAMWPLGESTRPLYAMGRWDEMSEAALEITTWDETQGGSQLTGLVVPQVARVLAHRGRALEARGLIDGYLPRAREIRDPQIYLMTLIASAVVAAALDDRDVVVESMEELLTPGNGWDRRFHTCQWALPDGPRALVKVGATDLAEKLLVGRGAEVTFLVRQEAASRAAIDEARGRLDTALPAYLELADWWAAHDCRFEHAQALLGAGRCEIALANPLGASAHLRSAREVFGTIGATALVTGVDQLLVATP